MKRTALILILSVIVFTLFTTVALCEGEASTVAPETTAVPEGGLVIPGGIVIAILVGAAAIGGFGGYYYARKR